MWFDHPVHYHYSINQVDDTSKHGLLVYALLGGFECELLSILIILGTWRG